MPLPACVESSGISVLLAFFFVVETHDFDENVVRPSCGWLFINIPVWEMNARRWDFGDVSFRLACGFFAPSARLQNRHSSGDIFHVFQAKYHCVEPTLFTLFTFFTFFTFFYKRTVWEIPGKPHIRFQLENSNHFLMKTTFSDRFGHNKSAINDGQCLLLSHAAFSILFEWNVSWMNDDRCRFHSTEIVQLKSIKSHPIYVSS